MQNILYPTDLSDEQWNLLQAVLPPRPARRGRGRPPADLRRICNALLYMVRAGCAWRLLPRDFGPWKTVYHYFRLWSRQGFWQTIHDVFRSVVRTQAGKRSQPTAAILDSQTVRSSDQAGQRGYDAAKKTKGIKRHVLVDTVGLLLAVCVTPADVPERQGARSLLERALACFRWLAVCGPTKATAERSWPDGWWRNARRAPCGWKSCRVSKTNVASKCCANVGSSNEPLAGL
jgi:putative transposase